MGVCVFFTQIRCKTIGAVNDCLADKDTKAVVIPSELQRVEGSTHFVDISGKIGAKILRLRFAPLRMTPYVSALLIL